MVAFNIAFRILDSWEFSDVEKAIVLGDIPVVRLHQMKGGKIQSKLLSESGTIALEPVLIFERKVGLRKIGLSEAKYRG